MLGTGKVGETLMTNAPHKCFSNELSFYFGFLYLPRQVVFWPSWANHSNESPQVPPPTLQPNWIFGGPRLSRSINVSQVPGPGSGSIRVLKLHLEASQLYLLPAGWMRISGLGMRICWLAVATMKYSWRNGGVRIYGYFAHQTQLCSRFPLALFSGVFPWIRPG